jgi:hypothetical protein
MTEPLEVLREILYWTRCRDGGTDQDDEVIRSIAKLASAVLLKDILHDKIAGTQKAPCPICGESITLDRQARTSDGRLIGTCGDAFTVASWIFDD